MTHLTDTIPAPEQPRPGDGLPILALAASILTLVLCTVSLALLALVQ